MKAPPTTEVCQPVVVAMYFNYLGYHSVIVDLFVYASAGITLVSELLPTARRGIGTTVVATIGLSGAVAAGK